jgi:HAD superfamily hydrolase (TIGR01548 family)
MFEYITIAQNLEMRSDAPALLKQVDTVVFDIDGVLLDVQGSFREVIRETVQYYLKKNFDLDSPQPLVTPDDVHQCKMAGRFNNDWDVAEMFAAFFIKKAIQHKNKSMLELQKVEPSFTEFIRLVAERGGGLDNAYEVLRGTLTGDERERLKNDVRRAEIIEMFQEFYAGINYCRRLYGRMPKFYRGEGRIENEQAVFRRDYFFKDLFKYGVLTGRTREEAALALEIVGLAGQLDPAAIIVDDGTVPAKPQPDGLVKITTALGSGPALYIGDTIDDWTVVKNFRQTTGSAMFFCHCLTGSNDPELLARLRAEGVEVIARDVNEIMKWLILQKKGGDGHASVSA